LFAGELKLAVPFESKKPNWLDRSVVTRSNTQATCYAKFHFIYIYSIKLILWIAKEKETCRRFYVLFNEKLKIKIKIQKCQTLIKLKLIKRFVCEKCLVVHSHPTPIPPSPTWTNNIVKKNGSHYTLSTISYIIGPSRQEWDKSGMRVYNQAQTDALSSIKNC